MSKKTEHANNLRDTYSRYVRNCKMTSQEIVTYQVWLEDRLFNLGQRYDVFSKTIERAYHDFKHRGLP